jgi:hypothetical protein
MTLWIIQWDPKPKVSIPGLSYLLCPRFAVIPGREEAKSAVTLPTLLSSAYLVSKNHSVSVHCAPHLGQALKI